MMLSTQPAVRPCTSAARPCWQVVLGDLGMQHRSIRRALAVLIVALAMFVLEQPVRAQSQPEPVAADEYRRRIKPIFEGRCIACHSCYNAPCQLNLQSYAGATRGATPRNVYDATRLKSVPPSRVGIDATTPASWRDKGFYDVLGGGDAGRSLLLRLTRSGRRGREVRGAVTPRCAGARGCPGPSLDARRDCQPARDRPWARSRRARTAARFHGAVEAASMPT